MPVRGSVLISLFGVGILYAGCGGSGGGADDGGGAGSGGGFASAGSGGAAAVPTGLPCAVERLLRDRCQQCHGSSTQFGAPLSLATRRDLAGPSFSDQGASAAALALARMADGARPMPPPPNAPATPDELAVLRAWVDAGMPERAPGEACGGAGGAGGAGGGAMPGGCTPDIALAAAAPYEMPESVEDQYVCFSYELPAGPKRHVIAAAPAIDNAKILHHLIAFQVPPGAGPGAAAEPCSALFPSDWKMIYGWGPGGLPLELPPEAGFPIEAGAPARFVVQAHYSNLKREAGHRDRTAINLCSTTELRPNDADVVAFGGVSFRLAAGKRVKLDCSAPASILGAGPVRALRAWPHMHTLGESFVGQVLHPDQSTTPLGAVLDYDFEHQLSYAVDATIGAGDVVKSSCTWDNTLGATDVLFGEETSREMCFNFITYYPRAPISMALIPAYAASCSTQEL
ncbi:MAG TPA: peptidylglycine alpha-amidating monooxygenase [Polyangiaceae bacterium]|nr:peptidylglycine alpha-amidating monooxygenase [Polyangiaceae bacterium]